MARSSSGATDQIVATFSSNVSNPWTMSAWFRATSLPGGGAYTTIVCIRNSGSAAASVALLKSTGVMAYYVRNAHTDPATIAISTGTWYHVVFTNTGLNNAGQGYINGVADGASYTPTLDQAYDQFGVFADNAGDPSIAGVRIADAAFWNVVLTPLEITALANGVRPYSIRSAALQIWWPLDGLVSPEPDLSGNVHNGTLTATAGAFGPPFGFFTPRWPQFNEFTPGGSMVFQQITQINFTALVSDTVVLTLHNP